MAKVKSKSGFDIEGNSGDWGYMSSVSGAKSGSGGEKKPSVLKMDSDMGEFASSKAPSGMNVNSTFWNKADDGAK